MNTLISISVQFFWAFIGALLGLVLPSILVWWQYKRRPELLGKWKSTYQGIDETQGTWVEEDIFIDVAWGKFRFKNGGSTYDYKYAAKGNVVQKVFVVGDWESIRPGANAYGAFILTISAQGDCMYGYWVGPDKSGARRYGRWVLARTDQGVDKAKRLIESMRMPNLTP